jgi:hypothetical protein
VEKYRVRRRCFSICLCICSVVPRPPLLPAVGRIACRCELFEPQLSTARGTGGSQEEFTEMHERQAKAQRMAAAVREAERRTESDEAQAQPAGLTDAPPPMLAAIFTPQTALHTPLTAGLGNGTNPYATFDAFTPSASSPGVAEAEAGAEASAGEEQPQRSSPEDSPYGDERAVRCTASEADASSTFPYATPAAPAAAATAAAAASGSTRRSARRG